MQSLTSHLRLRLLSVVAATLVVTAAGTVGSIATGTVPAAFAQDQGTPAAAPGGHGQRMGKLLMELDLSDAQKTQIRAIIADARKQNENVTDRDVRRANMKAAYGKVDTVLTPAQRTEFHAKLDAMHRQNQTAHPQ